MCRRDAGPDSASLTGIVAHASRDLTENLASSEDECMHGCVSVDAKSTLNMALGPDWTYTEYLYCASPTNTTTITTSRPKPRDVFTTASCASLGQLLVA